MISYKRKVNFIKYPFFLLLRTADGALSTVENSLNARYGYDMRSEVLCERGVVAITEPQRIVTSSALTATADLPEDFRPRFAEAYRLELQEWVTAESPFAVLGSTRMFIPWRNVTGVVPSADGILLFGRAARTE